MGSRREETIVTTESIRRDGGPDEDPRELVPEEERADEAETPRELLPDEDRALDDDETETERLVPDEERRVHDEPDPEGV